MKNPTLDAQVSAVLRRAAELVAAGWCQYWPALNAADKGIFPIGKAAVKFCLSGAVRRACYELSGEMICDELFIPAGKRLERVLKRKGWRELEQWNDADFRSQAEVVAALERAGGVK